MLRFFLVFVLTFMASPVLAKKIADVEVKEQIEVDGTTLLLNGAGIRKKFFFKVYIGELYLEEKTTDPEKVVALDGKKRVVMHFLYEKVEKEKLIDAWNEGFKANSDGETLKNLQQRIDSFNAFFNEEVVSGDTVVLDYSPENGTKVIIKGMEKGSISGKDFFDALLRIWIGKKPVTSDLKDDMLGK